MKTGWPHTGTAAVDLFIQLCLLVAKETGTVLDMGVKKNLFLLGRVRLLNQTIYMHHLALSQRADNPGIDHRDSTMLLHLAEAVLFE